MGQFDPTRQSIEYADLDFSYMRNRMDDRERKGMTVLFCSVDFSRRRRLPGVAKEHKCAHHRVMALREVVSDAQERLRCCLWASGVNTTNMTPRLEISCSKTVNAGFGGVGVSSGGGAFTSGSGSTDLRQASPTEAIKSVKTTTFLMNT